MKKRIMSMLRSAFVTDSLQQIDQIQSEVFASRRQMAYLLHHFQCSEGEKDSLDKYGFSVWSQTDEDGILSFLVSRLDIAKPKCLEIGAGNFLESNFRFLAEILNASVFAVDAREDLISEVRNQTVAWLAPVVPHQAWVTPRNVSEIVTKAIKEIGEIDILSIDLDGNDYWVLEAANLENIKLVMVETNSLFGGLAPVSVPQDDQFSRFTAHYSGLYWGASIQAFVHLLESRGFRLVGRNRKGFNAFFIRDEIVAGDPLLARLSRHVKMNSDTWGIREGRNSDGQLTFADPTKLLREAPDLPLIEVTTGKQIELGSLAQ